MYHRGGHYCLGSRKGVLEAKDNSRDVGSVSGPAVENEDQGDHEMEAAREDTKKVKMMPTIPYSASWEVNS